MQTGSGLGRDIQEMTDIQIVVYQQVSIWLGLIDAKSLIDRVTGRLCEQVALHCNIMFRETIHHLAANDPNCLEAASKLGLGLDRFHRIMERTVRGRVGFSVWRCRAVALSCSRWKLL